MKAITWTKYGSIDLLKYEDVPKPVPKDNEVLIKTHATTVTAGDCELRRFDIKAWIWLPVRLLMGIRKPRRPILGQELAGEVVEVGKAVNDLKPGDQVFTSTGIRMGGYAEYICLPETQPIVKKPDNMSYEEAATIPTGGINALHFLRKANIQPGQKVLINGAGGSIGTYGVQIAKYYGAEVTSVDRADKLDMLKAIGSDHVIDYEKDDFTQMNEKWDVIFDIVCTKPYYHCLNALNEYGVFLIANPELSHMLRAIWTSMVSKRIAIFALAGENKKDMRLLKQLVEAGELKAIIDKHYPLKDVPEAHRYVEAGHKKGNLIITMPHKD